MRPGGCLGIGLGVGKLGGSRCSPRSDARSFWITWSSLHTCSALASYPQELFMKRTLKFTLAKRGGVPSYDDKLGSS